MFQIVAVRPSEKTKATTAVRCILMRHYSQFQRTRSGRSEEMIYLSSPIIFILHYPPRDEMATQYRRYITARDDTPARVFRETCRRRRHFSTMYKLLSRSELGFFHSEIQHRYFDADIDINMVFNTLMKADISRR